MLSRDGWAGLICLGGSLGLLYLTRGLPQSALVPIGPAFYPRIVLAVTAVLSALLLVTTLWARRGPGARGAAPERRAYGLVALTFAVFGGYVLLLPGLGYRLGTFLFLLALQAVLDPSPRQHALRLLGTALATTLLTHLVFESYLSVLLPRGRWTGF